MPKAPAKHGTRAKFNAGCTDGPEGTACDPCKKANRDYFKARNQAKNAEKHGGTVTVLKTAATSTEQPAIREIGGVEAGVILELEGLPTLETRQGLVQTALTLARCLDSPLAIAQHPSAARQLADILDKLRKGAEKKGRLSAVRAMTGAATG